MNVPTTIEMAETLLLNGFINSEYQYGVVLKAETTLNSVIDNNASDGEIIEVLDIVLDLFMVINEIKASQEFMSNSSLPINDVHEIAIEDFVISALMLIGATALGVFVVTWLL